MAYWLPSESSAQKQLWVANADFSSPKKLPATQSGSSAAAWSPDGTMVAVTSNDVGLFELVIVPVDGGPITRVTEGSGIKLPLLWRNDDLNYFGTSAGGSFQSFVYSPKTKQSRSLIPGETRPHLGATSPDGKHVAYFLIEGERSTIWVADADGQNKRQLTKDGFESLEQYQEWSPDSKELLYESRRTGHTDLWIVPIDGGAPRQLTRDIRDDSSGTWSPDGKWIAFISNRGKQTDVWAVPSAGGAEVRVTDTAAEESGPLWWQPGTNRITFGLQTTNSSMWSMDLATGKEQQLLPNTSRVVRFHPSPDGKQLLYVVEKGGGIQDLMVMPIGGGSSRTLVEGGGVQNPNWSADSQHIVFGSDRSGSFDVWAVAVADAALRQLTTWPGFEQNPAIGKDNWVYFTCDKDTRVSDVWKVSLAGGEPTRVTKHGAVVNILAVPTAPGLIGLVIGSSGQFTIARFRDNGASNPVWDKSNSFYGGLSQDGETVFGEVQQRGGKMQPMLLKADGSSARPLSVPGQSFQGWSIDGKWMLYGIPTAGVNDLAIFNVADGSSRRLTTTRESEEGAEFTPDGKTVIFRRVDQTQRVVAVDLSSVIKRSPIAR